MSTLSKDKQLTAIQLLATGLSQSETARKIGVTRQAVSLWLKDVNFSKQVELRKQELLEASPKEPPGPLHELAPSKNNLVAFPPRSPNPTQPSREVAREQELQFLQQIENHLLPLLREGSVRAASTLLKLSQERSKILGLYQRSLPLLEAVSLLLAEGVMTESQAVIVQDGVLQLIDKLEEHASQIRKLEESNT